jgi:CCR4-NOT transcription complex subunit 1
MRFLAPFLRRGELTDTTRALYIGTQRILLVLLHDFPEFLSQAYYALGDAIPSSCIQLHNLVLSAFPVDAGIRLPDPLQPALKLEVLPETQIAPHFLTDYTIALTTADLRTSLDQYLSTKQPANFASIIKDRLALSGAQDKPERDPKFNVPLVNSLVLYLGVVALNSSKTKTGSVKYDSQSESAKLLRQLVEETEPEGTSYLSLSLL